MSNDDSLDWKNYGRENIINTVVNHKHLGNGSIILCHNGAKYTAQALDDMIKGLEEKDYEIEKKRTGSPAGRNHDFPVGLFYVTGNKDIYRIVRRHVLL